MNEIVLKKQLHYIYQSSTIGIGGHLFILIIITYMLHNAILLSTLTIGFTSHLLILSARLYTLIQYKKNKDDIKDSVSIKRWIRYYQLGVFMTGLAWGMVFFFIQDASTEHIFFIYAIIIGLASAGIATIGIIFSVYISFVLPMIGSSIIFMLVQCTEVHYFASFLMFFGTLYIILASYRYSNNFIQMALEQENLRYQAEHDALTELPNRILLNSKLEQTIENAKHNNTKVLLLYINLDHFKGINESLGHETGDEILKIVTSRLKETIEEKGTVARVGGDEFGIVLEDVKLLQDASLVAEKILNTLTKVMNIDNNILYVSSSIGISIFPDDGGSSQNLIKYANSAMYKAKDEGRNNFQYYNSTMTEEAFQRVIMETNLRAALKNEEFVVYYQPQVNGVTNKIIGMEALVRWQHPSMGLISPAKFIPLAESTGLIVELDRLVMKQAMNQISQWYRDGINPGVLSMNLAVKQLQQTDFIEMFTNLMRETECKAQWIELEVTESQIMTNPDEAIKLLTQISDLGIELAVDDFGTGYSSLAYLKRLPIDKLKIDQAFVNDLPYDEEDSAITKAVIALAKSLNLKVIAEGVEKKEQKKFLVENGCENIQGYFYSKPIPADKFKVILVNGFNF